MNEKRNIPVIVRKVVKQLAKEYQPERIILFGSYAWGTPAPDSDVDILIVKDTKERPIDRRVAVRNTIASIRAKIPFDFIVVTPEELSRSMSNRNSVYLDIVNCGIVMYDA